MKSLQILNKTKTIYGILILILLGTSTYAQKGLFEFYVGMEEDEVLKILESRQYDKSGPHKFDPPDENELIGMEKLYASIEFTYFLFNQERGCTQSWALNIKDGKVASLIFSMTALDACESGSRLTCDVLTKKYGKPQVDTRGTTEYRKWDHEDVTFIAEDCSSSPMIHCVPRLSKKEYSEILGPTDRKRKKEKTKLEKQYAKRLSKVKLEMTMDEVKEKLGEPDFDTTINNESLWSYGQWVVIFEGDKVKSKERVERHD